MADLRDLIADTRLVHLVGAPGGVPPFATPARTQRLDFDLWHQEMDNWCWAAVSSAIGNFYAGSVGFHQCDVAAIALGRPCCPSPSLCDEPYFLEDGLGAVGHPATVTKTIPNYEIQADIDAGRPVAARIQWAAGGGHFVVIEGYSTTVGGQLLYVEDPWSGGHDVMDSEFRTSYQGAGSWSHTYRTAP